MNSRSRHKSNDCWQDFRRPTWVSRDDCLNHDVPIAPHTIPPMPMKRRIVTRVTTDREQQSAMLCDTDFSNGLCVIFCLTMYDLVNFMKSSLVFLGDVAIKISSCLLYVFFSLTLKVKWCPLRFEYIRPFVCNGEFFHSNHKNINVHTNNEIQPCWLLLLRWSNNQIDMTQSYHIKPCWKNCHKLQNK